LSVTLFCVFWADIIQDNKHPNLFQGMQWLVY